MPLPAHGVVSLAVAKFRRLRVSAVSQCWCRSDATLIYPLVERSGCDALTYPDTLRILDLTDARQLSAAQCVRVSGFASLR